jgi:hypothetical protein
MAHLQGARAWIDRPGCAWKRNFETPLRQLDDSTHTHLVLTHEAAVANNVSDQNGGEATLHGFLPEKGE